jgi:hypothetical protein
MNYGLSLECFHFGKHYHSVKKRRSPPSSPASQNPLDFFLKMRYGLYLFLPHFQREFSLRFSYKNLQA